jgi:hypothetical protein
MSEKFTKNLDNYKQIKLSQSDIRNVLIGIDVTLDNMVKESKNVFNKYIDCASVIQKLSNNICEIATCIETDQFDNNHFRRVGGKLQTDSVSGLNKLIDYTRDFDKIHTEYFTLCSHIRQLMIIRDAIDSKVNNDDGVDKTL